MFFRSDTAGAVSGAKHWWKAMSSPKGSKTERNLKEAFAKESQTNRCYLYFARTADEEGHEYVSALFRSIADVKTGHAHGHLEYLEGIGDPVTAAPIGTTTENLKAAIAGEAHECMDRYSDMTRTARDEGFDEISNWFETLAKTKKFHNERLKKALDSLD